jgi:hypothetical protein
MANTQKKGGAMKKWLTIIVCILFYLTLNAQVKTDEKKVEINTETGDTTFTESVIITQTEDITPRNSMIVINPLKFFLFYNLSYFYRISDQVTIGAGFQVPTISGVDGFGINAEARIYPTGKRMRGFYIAPNISYNSLTSEEGSTSPFSFGALAGWQWFPGDEFAIGLGIGMDYYIGSVSGGDSDMESYNGTVPAVRFDIGYAW